MEFTKIEKHPLRDTFMLYSPYAPGLPPYFGSKEKCLMMKTKWEKNLSEMFKQLSPERQKEVKEWSDRKMQIN